MIPVGEVGTGRTLVKKVPGYEPEVTIIRLHPAVGPEPELPFSVQEIVRRKDEVVATTPMG